MKTPKTPKVKATKVKAQPVTVTKVPKAAMDKATELANGDVSLIEPNTDGTATVYNNRASRFYHTGH